MKRPQPKSRPAKKITTARTRAGLRAPNDAKPPAKSRLEPKGRPKPAGIEIPLGILRAWERTIVQLARLPRGTNKNALRPKDLFRSIIARETEAMVDLWEIFNTDRGRLAKKLLSDRRFTVPYLLGFHLANIARLLLVLERLDRRYDLAIFRRTGLVTQDLGAGTGAMTQALLFGHRAPVKAHVTDDVGLLLDTVHVLLEDAPKEHVVLTHKSSIDALDAKHFVAAQDEVNVYLLGYVWNELEKNQRARAKIQQILSAHAERKEPAVVFFLEPANTYPARGAMTLRDDLLQKGFLPLYPCPHATSCPMLARSRDWCFSKGLWNRPESIVAVDRALEIDRASVSTSGYVMVTEAARGLFPEKNHPQGILVGEPLRSGEAADAARDKREWLVCTDQGTLTKKKPTDWKRMRGEPV